MSSRFPVHLHIPKTAGTSIRLALDLPRFYPAHLTAKALRKHVGEQRWREGLTFTVVRNPFARLLSIYTYRATHRNAAKRERFNRHGLTFKSWLRINLVEKGLRPVVHPHFSMSIHDWLDGEELDYIGRFEEMPKVFRRIKGSCGDYVVSPLPHAHRTAPQDYKDHFDAESRRWVERHFAADLERFRYRF